MLPFAALRCLQPKRQIDGEARLRAVVEGFKVPSRMIATDDDAFFCVLDPAADAIALIPTTEFA